MATLAELAMRRTWLDRLATWETFLALLTCAVVLYAVVALPNFATLFNLSQAIAGASERALIVLPMALLIIAREIDLSVASILALSSVVFGVAVAQGAPLVAAMALALATGALCGAFNGLLVTRFNLPSLVVTLGTLAMFRGLGYVILGPDSVNKFPESFSDFGVDTVGETPIPWTIVPFLVLAPVFAIILQSSTIGRRIYAIGGNPTAALYSGVRINRIRFVLFVASGLVCALAGIVFTARLANARADNAVGVELDVITTALLGGVSVFGGRGKLTGVLWALVLIATLRNVLGLEEIGGDAQGTIIGLLLVATLLASNAAQRLFAALNGRQARGDSGDRSSGDPPVLSTTRPTPRTNG
jgi:rhamnose transport system permease protein